jgi:2-alkyl-3-oxoalkanoate reductase
MSELQGKTVLVTGGTGFLGSALANELARQGAKVRVLARRPERNKWLTEPNIEAIQGDLAQADSLVKAVQDCEIVFHVAVSYGKLDEQLKVNVEGTHALAQASAKANVKRFVHVSSLAAYGYKVRGTVTESTPIQQSIEPYSHTKAEAERAVQSVAQATGLSYSIVRPGGIYGANSGVWTHTMFTLAKRKPLIFAGAGQGNVPLIHVDDLVNLIIVCSTHPNAHQEIFNAVMPKPVIWREFLQAYAKLVGNRTWLGIPEILVKLGARGVSLFASKQSGLIALYELVDYGMSEVFYSTDKAKQKLGWEAQLSLDEGVQRCIPFLKAKGLLK